MYLKQLTPMHNSLLNVCINNRVVFRSSVFKRFPPPGPLHTRSSHQRTCSSTNIIRIRLQIHCLFTLIFSIKVRVSPSVSYIIKFVQRGFAIGATLAKSVLLGVHWRLNVKYVKLPAAIFKVGHRI